MRAKATDNHPRCRPACQVKCSRTQLGELTRMTCTMRAAQIARKAAPHACSVLPSTAAAAQAAMQALLSDVCRACRNMVPAAHFLSIQCGVFHQFALGTVSAALVEQLRVDHVWRSCGCEAGSLVSAPYICSCAPSTHMAAFAVLVLQLGSLATEPLFCPSLIMHLLLTSTLDVTHAPDPKPDPEHDPCGCITCART